MLPKGELNYLSRARFDLVLLGKKMKKIVLHCLLLLLLFAPLQSQELQGAGQLSQEKLDALLTRIENNFGQIDTLFTRFTQEKKISLFTGKIISKGFCLFKAPEKLRLEYVTPYKSALTINNERVSKYEYINEHWKKLDSGNQEIMIGIMKNITDWLKGRFRDTDLYKIRGFDQGHKWIVLEPKNKDFKKMIRSFEMGINSTLTGLDYIIIHERSDDYTKIMFHHDKLNIKLPDNLFKNGADGPHPVSF